jgi:uncharacterized protein (DUF1684 family)
MRGSSLKRVTTRLGSLELTVDIYAFRQRKDAFFRDDPNAPVAGEAFGGLRYFPVSPSYVFLPRVQPFASPEQVELMTSVGDLQPYLRYGQVGFMLGEETRKLTLFQTLGDDASFFLPFRDATNGRESYAAGRYLDVPRLSGNKVRLDFNYAYNPYCAYSERYRCPLPPLENRLTVAVRAGEKTYKVAADVGES